MKDPDIRTPEGDRKPVIEHGLRPNPKPKPDPKPDPKPSTPKKP